MGVAEPAQNMGECQAVLGTEGWMNTEGKTCEDLAVHGMGETLPEVYCHPELRGPESCERGPDHLYSWCSLCGQGHCRKG